MQLNKSLPILISILCTISTITDFAEGADVAEVKTEASGDLSIHVWDRYVRRFRRDHNVSVSIAYFSSSWQIDKFGEISDSNFKSSHWRTVAEYSFHLPIAGKTGYFLGTSAGYDFDTHDKIDDKFSPSNSWILPGARGGIVYNFDPTGRIFAGAGAQLERFDALKTKRIGGQWEQAALTGESLQFFVGIDYFFALDSALHLGWSSISTYFPAPTEAQDYLVNIRMKAISQGGEIGLLYHFL